MAFGPWLDDSIPFELEITRSMSQGDGPGDVTNRTGYSTEVNVTGVGGGGASSDPGDGDLSAEAVAAWATTSPLDFTSTFGPPKVVADGSVTPTLTGVFDAFGWGYSYVNLFRPADYLVLEGLLPGFMPPGATGVEWEPTGLADSMRLKVGLERATGGADPGGPEKDPRMFLLGTGKPEGYYIPSSGQSEIADDLRSGAVLGDIDNGGDVLAYTYLDLDPDWTIPLSGEASMLVTLLDRYTYTETIPSVDPDSPDYGLGLDRQWSVVILGTFTPRYRFIFPGAAPPCRLHPRKDSLGVGGARVFPPPQTHQASGRRAGGFY